MEREIIKYPRAEVGAVGELVQGQLVSRIRLPLRLFKLKSYSYPLSLEIGGPCFFNGDEQMTRTTRRTRKGSPNSTARQTVLKMPSWCLKELTRSMAVGWLDTCSPHLWLVQSPCWAFSPEGRQMEPSSSSGQCL
uniref:Uncharacterized protein n=1 Tax=Chrysemys picta bellii TaxID=8478 RepID=A0A8C3HLV6_CHRPI